MGVQDEAERGTGSVHMGKRGKSRDCFPCLHACGVTAWSLWAHRLQQASPKFHFQGVWKPPCFLKKLVLEKKSWAWYWKRKAGLKSLSGNVCRMQIFESSIAKPEWLLNHNKSYLAFLQCLSSYVLFTNINTWSSTTHLAEHCALWELSHPSLVDEQTCGVSGDCLPHVRQDICSSGWNMAKISAWAGRNLSLVALGIYRSRDLVTDPEKNREDCRGPKKLNFSSYLFWAFLCPSNALAMWRCHPI